MSKIGVKTVVTRGSDRVEAIQSIAQTAYRRNHRMGRIAIDFESQSSDIHIDHVRQRISVVDVYIRRLRLKIDGDSTHSMITTVRGLGYRLDGLDAA